MNEQDYDPTRSGASLSPQPAMYSGQTAESLVFQNLTRETLKEMRARRRWSIFFKLCFFLLIFFIVAMMGGMFAVFKQGDSSYKGGSTSRHVAMVEINGPITSEDEFGSKSTISALQSAFSASNSVGVIIALNTPGGSPVQAGRIYDEIRRLRKKYPDKPVYAVAGDLCASAGYYIASAADQIVVDKASLVGSIGVLMSSFGVTGLMQKVGVERRLYTAGANKGILDPFSETKPSQVQFVQVALDQLHQQFINAVREGRGNRLKETPDMFSGLFWTGEQAVGLGLADSFGSVRSVSRTVFKTDNIIDYTGNDKLSDRLLKVVGASMAGEFAARMSAPLTPQLQ